MAWVTVTNAVIKNANPSSLTTPFIFEITFKCAEDLDYPLLWRLIYVGSPDNKFKDQELERLELGPLKKGILKFSFKADPPDFAKIDQENLHGSTVILLEVSYCRQEFLRIGWYLHNVYNDPPLEEDPPDVHDITKMHRFILADEPRVTKFNIQWSNSAQEKSETNCPDLVLT